MCCIGGRLARLMRRDAAGIRAVVLAIRRLSDPRRSQVAALFFNACSSASSRAAPDSPAAPRRFRRSNRISIGWAPTTSMRCRSNSRPRRQRPCASTAFDLRPRCEISLEQQASPEFRYSFTNSGEAIVGGPHGPCSRRAPAIHSFQVSQPRWSTAMTSAAAHCLTQPPQLIAAYGHRSGAASLQGSNCALWQDRFADPSTYAPVKNDIPTLILTGEFDDRAPTEHGRQIASRLKRAYHYDFPGETHGQLSPGCHESIIWQFLENPAREPDAACIAAMTSVTFETSNLDLQTFVFRITDADRTSAFAGCGWRLSQGPEADDRDRAAVGRLVGDRHLAQPRSTVPVFEGRVERGVLTFRAVSPDGDRTITISGTVNGDESGSLPAT